VGSQSEKIEATPEKDGRLLGDYRDGRHKATSSDEFEEGGLKGRPNVRRREGPGGGNKH